MYNTYIQINIKMLYSFKGYWSLSKTNKKTLAYGRFQKQTKNGKLSTFAGLPFYPPPFLNHLGKTKKNII